MQLKKQRRTLRTALMAASCALLGAAEARSEPGVDGNDGDWVIDSALLYYKEAAGRVQTVEPVVNASKDMGDDRKLIVGLAYDSLSGGSPNGAIPSRSAQTFATPSGLSLQAPSGIAQTYTTPSGRVVARLQKVTLYTVAPGALPIDTGFHDRRIAGNAGWEQPLGQNDKISFGAGLSHELDFLSLSAHAAIAHDLFNKNTTVSLGAAFESDRVEPIGGAPIPGSDYTRLDKQGNRSKNDASGLLSVTQVMSRRWLMQLNLAYDASHGYLNDPYKILSIVDANGIPAGYRFESRPQDRNRRSVFFENKIALNHDVINFELRYMSDSWQIKSYAADLRYHFAFADGGYLEPHLRAYRQQAADFYHLYLLQQNPLPQFMSADPRLAAFDAVTVGLKYAMQLEDHGELSFRLEGYRQTGRHVESGVGQLQGLDLYPGLKTIIFQIGWRFGL
jgi:hypothetical protein